MRLLKALGRGWSATGRSGKNVEFLKKEEEKKPKRIGRHGGRGAPEYGLPTFRAAA